MDFNFILNAYGHRHKPFEIAIVKLIFIIHFDFFFNKLIFSNLSFRTTDAFWHAGAHPGPSAGQQTASCSYQSQTYDCEIKKSNNINYCYIKKCKRPIQNHMFSNRNETFNYSATLERQRSADGGVHAKGFCGQDHLASGVWRALSEIRARNLRWPVFIRIETLPNLIN